jgi:hypothetical protein
VQYVLYPGAQVLDNCAVQCCDGVGNVLHACCVITQAELCPEQAGSS